MAKKRAKQKKARSQYLTENAVKIKCCYCDARETCKYRAQKESTEKIGITTKCTMTPNKKKQAKK